jgi:hypothetical protein
MNLKDTGTCAVKEICNLANRGAKDNMADFCRISLKGPVRYYNMASRSQSLFCFYLFTSGEGTYGMEFARFIRRHKLGPVIGTAPVKNKAYHPDHSNRAWLWSPNRDALAVWWKENTGK